MSPQSVVETGEIATMPYAKQWVLCYGSLLEHVLISATQYHKQLDTMIVMGENTGEQSTVYEYGK